MAELYRQKVTALADALKAPETRTEAKETLRGLIDAIMWIPEEGVFRIELKGNLAAMRAPRHRDHLFHAIVITHSTAS
jgi:hypothetical protein